VAGGVKLVEPAVDLGIISSMISSFLNRAIESKTVVCGEVGLTGEVRGIGQVESRIKEAFRMGFARCIIPSGVAFDNLSKSEIDVIRIKNIRELTDHLFE